MTRLARTRALILIYALLNATCYCALLPLWEGFDEYALPAAVLGLLLICTVATGSSWSQSAIEGERR